MDKRAPVQGWEAGIPWELHLEAYSVYAKRYGSQRALIEGGCRGGFSTGELDMFIPGWRDRIEPLNVANARIAALEAALVAIQEFRDSLDKPCAEIIYAGGIADRVMKSVPQRGPE